MAGYFSIFLVVLTLSCGLIWALDAKLWAPKRRARLAEIETTNGVTLSAEDSQKVLAESALVENARSMFPLIAAITIFRSFIYEPFQIPSGSMVPTLLVGDFIAVEKFSYGVKDPIWRKTLMETNLPKRGDIVVFKYPVDPRLDFIKRTIGLPGDQIVYRDKQLFIRPNCATAGELDCKRFHKVETKVQGPSDNYAQGSQLVTLEENLFDVQHNIALNPAARDYSERYWQQKDSRNNEWTVPEGHYFVMGDSRDNSQDSRYWGFVPEENLVGRAVFIWMSFEMDRSPDSILPSWVPTGVRLSRIGAIQ